MSMHSFLSVLGVQLVPQPPFLPGIPVLFMNFKILKKTLKNQSILQRFFFNFFAARLLLQPPQQPGGREIFFKICLTNTQIQILFATLLNTATKF